MHQGKLINLIWAEDERGLIGNKNDLPWEKITEDMVYFRETTTPYPVLIGRNTWETIPEKFRPLKNRQNIVLSRNSSGTLTVPEGVLIASSFNDAVLKAEGEKVFVIGGAEIYRLALPYADNLYVTHICAQFKGDTYFPEYAKQDWHLKNSRGLLVGPPTGKIRIRFEIYSPIEKGDAAP